MEQIDRAAEDARDGGPSDVFERRLFGLARGQRSLRLAAARARLRLSRRFDALFLTCLLIIKQTQQTISHPHDHLKLNGKSVVFYEQYAHLNSRYADSI